MKKSISILLVLIMVSSCFAIASCNWGEIFGKITSTTTTTTTLPDASTVEFEHSDNFTEDDIEFVRSLHGQENNRYTMHSITSYYSLSTLIRSGQGGWPLFLVHFENPYIIVPYIKPNTPNYEYDENGNYYFDVRRYVWYKFDVSEDIPDSIGDCKRGRPSYLLYDCTIRKDIANGIEYNRECKYYLEYNGESSLELTKEDMLIYYPWGNIGKSDSKFIKRCGNEGTSYHIYIDDEGNENLVFMGEYYDSVDEKTTNILSDYLQEYYEILCPYLTRNEDFDVIYYSGNGVDYHIFNMVQIDLDLFTDLMFKNGRS